MLADQLLGWFSAARGGDEQLMGPHGVGEESGGGQSGTGSSLGEEGGGALHAVEAAEGNVAGAAGHVENARARQRVQGRHEPVLPISKFD